MGADGLGTRSRAAAHLLALRTIKLIRTPRLALRPWQAGDEALLHEAVLASVEHLRPWVDWVKPEPISRVARAAVVAQLGGSFRRGTSYCFAIFDPQQTAVLGGAGLHPRIGAGAMEIGYWLAADRVGRGLATEAAAALTRVGFERTGLRLIEIHCDPENRRSSAIPARLGYTLATTVPACLKSADGTPRDTMIWRLTADGYPASPSRSVPIEVVEGMSVPPP